MNATRVIDLRAIINTARAARVISSVRHTTEYGKPRVLFVGFGKMKDIMHTLRRLAATEQVLDESTPSHLS